MKLPKLKLPKLNLMSKIKTSRKTKLLREKRLEEYNAGKIIKIDKVEK